MDTIVRGSKFPQGQRVVLKYDPQTGIVVDNDYNGAGQAEMQALFYDFIQSGIACELTFEKDKASLKSSDSTQQTTLDTWEIAGSEESPDGLSHPTLLSICTDDEIRAIRAGINAAETTDGTSLQDIIDNGILDALTDADKETVLKFIGLQVRGSTEYFAPSYVVRHTTNAPARTYGSNIADDGVNQIYSFAQLLSEVQNSGYWLFPMPAALVTQVSFLASNPPPTPIKNPDDYFFGWFKSPPTKTTAANNRLNIVTEYTLKQLSTVYYKRYEG